MVRRIWITSWCLEAAIDAGPAVAAALAGLDFDDYRHKTGKSLVATESFTGRGITAEDLRRIEAADIAFQIVPDLPALYRWLALHRATSPDPVAAVIEAGRVMTEPFSSVDLTPTVRGQSQGRMKKAHPQPEPARRDEVRDANTTVDLR